MKIRRKSTCIVLHAGICLLERVGHCRTLCCTEIKKRGKYFTDKQKKLLFVKYPLQYNDFLCISQVRKLGERVKGQP